MGRLEGVIRARRRQRLPVVLTVGEVRAVLSHLKGTEALVAQLLYGSGLRLMEALRLRIKDVDLQQRCITVHSGKGDKDRRRSAGRNVLGCPTKPAILSPSNRSQPSRGLSFYAGGIRSGRSE